MTDQKSDPRVTLASERTLLAWVCTSLAMMGFGFVVARFGLSLWEIPQAAPEPQSTPSGSVSLWFGTGLVVLGAVSSFLAGTQHLLFISRLGGLAGTNTSLRCSLAVFVSSAIGLIGVLIAAYLLVMNQ